MSIETVTRRNGKGRAYKVRYRDHANKPKAETFEVKADAETRDATIRQSKQRREPIPRLGRGDAGETFETFAHDVWWPNHVEAQKMVTKTQERYATFLDKHLIPRIGGDALAFIDVPRVLEIKTQLAADKVPDYTAARALKLLRQILTFAVLNGRLTQNPADVLGHSKMLPPQGRKTDIRPLWPDETEAIRRAMLARQTPHALRDATLVSVLAYAGLRPGEALGLAWENINKDSIRVERGVSGGKLRPTKTGDRRTVPSLIKPLMADLAAWRKASKRSGKSIVFPGEDGKPWSVTAYGNWRNRTWKACAPDGYVIYDLRHGYSLLLAREGVDDRDAARRMGHSTTMHSHAYDGFIDDLRSKPKRSMEAVVKAARKT
jgi:integrase